MVHSLLSSEYEFRGDEESKELVWQWKYFMGGGSMSYPRKTKKIFPCLMCNRKFSQNAGRYNHMKKIHQVYSGDKSNVRCLEKGCTFVCSFKEKLQIHLTEDHGIEMEITKKKFDNLQDFLRWKDQFEREEKSRFVKKSGSRVRDEGFRIAYYYCSRSGNSFNNNKNKKKSKLIGTSKSRNYCTASITLVELPNGKLEVRICSTHYGHDNNLKHLRLTQTEKFQIAEQLCQGVPRELVLDNVRASAGSNVDRIHLITMKDVRNIAKAYGIQSNTNEKTKNMYVNLSTWAKGIEKTKHCPLLFFKASDQAVTRSHDVVVIVSTAGQLEVIHKHGRPGIYYITEYVMQNKQPTYNAISRPNWIIVCTLMLLDDMNEAVPVSFMVTDISPDRSKLSLFFETLKSKEPEMSALTLFTDDNEEMFNSWCSVFKEKPLHLWSNRFVDNDWRDSMVNIPDEEKQVSIYETLYSFLESSDKQKLDKTLTNFVTQLQNEEITCEFGNYLASKYIGSEEMWAGCFEKRNIGVNAQLNMERCCNEIEMVGARKHWDRNFFVRIIQNLLKIVSEKQCVRQSKLLRQVQELPTHHKLALSISPDYISEINHDCWRVNSIKDPENIYSLVVRKNVSCESSKCIMYCSKCNACAHQFICSCSVFCFDKTMCKHIHAVAINVIPKLELIASNSQTASANEPKPSSSKETDLNNGSKQEDFEFENWFNGKPIRKKRKQNQEKEELNENNICPENEPQSSIKRKSCRNSLQCVKKENPSVSAKGKQNVNKVTAGKIKAKFQEKRRKSKTLKKNKLRIKKEMVVKKEEEPSSSSQRRPNILRKCKKPRPN